MALHSALVPTSSQQPVFLPMTTNHPKSLWSKPLPSFNANSITRGRMQACYAAKADQEAVRPLANFPTNIWKDIDTFTFDATSRFSEFEHTNGKQREKLQNKVKEMLIAPTNDLVEKVRLIDSLRRLGVSYHFKAEIEEQLNHIFEAHPNLVHDNDYDLDTISLLFRVFREHGYKMSSSCFNKFKDNDGNFKQMLTNDAKGMLSLYEATHLRHNGEDILDQALVFTKAHLKSLAEKSNPLLEKQILSALEMPMYKNAPRLEALRSISFYEKEESGNETLLLFAKLDYNQVQLLHQQEMNHLIRWRKDLKTSTLPYIRDRLVDLYFLSVIVYAEPCYSRARIFLTKFLMLLTVIDDTYDAYGLIGELRVFTDAIHRWDMSALDELPDYMQIVYSDFLNLFDEISNELTGEETLSRVSYTKEKQKEIVDGYHVEAEWLNEKYVPSFDEYMKNGIITGGVIPITASVFLGMEEEIAGMKEFEWLESRPKIVRAVSLVARLADDVSTHEFEQNRPHIPSAVEIHMNEYGWSREKTVEKFNLVLENTWKDINEDCMKPTAVSMEILHRLLNIRRLLELCYSGVDKYTNSHHLKEYVIKLFFTQLPI